MVDAFGNNLDYSQDLIQIKTSHIDLIGPNRLSLVNGTTAFYVKTTQPGKAKITVTNTRGQTKSIEINVKKGKLEI